MSRDERLKVLYKLRECYSLHNKKTDKLDLEINLIKQNLPVWFELRNKKYV